MRGLACLLALGAVVGCASSGRAADSDLRLTARPGHGGGACAPGTHTIRSGSRVALMQVTRPAQARPRGLILALHGSGDPVIGGLYIFRAAADRPGLVILSPKSAGGSWGVSADVPFLDLALRRAFSRCRIDPRRVAVGGFSAGGSLSTLIGLANGDLFHEVIALSPGGALPPHRVGKPHVFVAHGRHDQVIPFSLGGAALARELERDGYRVTFRPFADGHRVARDTSEQAVRWLLADWR